MSRTAAMGFDFEATHPRDHGIISPSRPSKIKASEKSEAFLILPGLYMVYILGINIKYNTPQLLDQKFSDAKLIFRAVLCTLVLPQQWCQFQSEGEGSINQIISKRHKTKFKLPLKGIDSSLYISNSF